MHKRQLHLSFKYHSGLNYLAINITVKILVYSKVFFGLQNKYFNPEQDSSILHIIHKNFLNYDSNY